MENKNEMDVWQILRVAVRRWYVFLPLLALTAVAAMAATDGTVPKYTATADAFVSAPPSKPSELKSSIENSGGVQFAGSFGQSAVNDDVTRKKLQDEGFYPDYTALWTRGSLKYTVTATGSSPDTAEGTVGKVLELMDEKLKEYQVSRGVINPAALYTIQPATEGTSVSNPQFPGRNRTRIVIGAIGVSLSLAIAIGFDALLSKRRSGRKTGPGSGNMPTGNIPQPGLRNHGSISPATDLSAQNRVGNLPVTTSPAAARPANPPAAARPANPPAAARPATSPAAARPANPPAAARPGTSPAAARPGTAGSRISPASKPHVGEETVTMRMPPRNNASKEALPPFSTESTARQP